MIGAGISSTQYSLEELLQEVNLGNYGNFRNYLNNNLYTYLNLSHSFAANIDLEHLGKSLLGTPVEALELVENDINDMGAKKLGIGLRGNSTLKSLLLGSNKIGSVGARSLIEDLKTTNVIKLSLFYNNIGDDNNAKGLIKSLSGSKINNIDLCNNNICLEDAKECFRLHKNSDILIFKFDNNGCKISDILDILSGSPLNHLSLLGKEINDELKNKIITKINETLLFNLNLNCRVLSSNDALEATLKTNFYNKFKSLYYLIHAAQFTDVQQSNYFKEKAKREITEPGTDFLELYMQLLLEHKTQVLNMFCAYNKSFFNHGLTYVKALQAKPKNISESTINELSRKPIKKKGIRSTCAIS